MHFFLLALEALNLILLHSVSYRWKQYLDAHKYIKLVNYELLQLFLYQIGLQCYNYVTTA